MFLFFLSTTGHVLGVILFSPFGSRPVRAIVHSWSRSHRWLLRDILGIRFQWDGAIPDGAYLIAVKHESMVEAIDTLSFADTPVVVMKRELAYSPLFGWVCRRYGVIPVDRSAGAAALREMMAQGKAAIADHRPIVIFPEGTRVPSGQQPELRPGFAGMYRMLGLPVVPVAVDSGRLWQHGFAKPPGVVHFKVGEIIPPGLRRDQVEARVHAAINVLNSRA
ncbi:MAG: lysophospholipid acyltransferase family protein [Sphingomicrobium sp.]